MTRSTVSTQYVSVTELSYRPLPVVWRGKKKLKAIQLGQQNLSTKIIPVSALNQQGLITTCLGRELPKLALFHIASRALFKELLFVAEGSHWRRYCW